MSEQELRSSNFIFKLNVQPHILQKLDTKGFDSLKNESIPTAIFNTFNDLLSPVEEQLGELQFKITNDFNYISKSEDYSQLIKITSEIAELYKQITIDYKNNKGIFYTPEFLEKLDQAIELRKIVLSRYSILVQSSNHYPNTLVDDEIERTYGFKIDSDVGKGLDHIRRVTKMRLYLLELEEKDAQDVLVNYHYDSEFLIIHNVNIDEAVEHCRMIEEKINSQKNEIGKIVINPVYTKLALTRDDLSSIEIITTYPNGTGDEFDLLLKATEETGAKEARTKLVSSDGQPLEQFTAKAIDLAVPPSKKGDLRDIKYNGKSIIDFGKSIIRFKS